MPHLNNCQHAAGWRAAIGEKLRTSSMLKQPDAMSGSDDGHLPALNTDRQMIRAVQSRIDTVRAFEKLVA